MRSIAIGLLLLSIAVTACASPPATSHASWSLCTTADQEAGGCTGPFDTTSIARDAVTQWASGEGYTNPNFEMVTCGPQDPGKACVVRVTLFTSIFATYVCDVTIDYSDSEINIVTSCHLERRADPARPGIDGDVLHPDTQTPIQYCTIEDQQAGFCDGPVTIYPDDPEAIPAMEALQNISRDNAPTATCKVRRGQYHIHVACCVVTGSDPVSGLDRGVCCDATINTEDGYVSGSRCEEYALVGTFLNTL